MYEQAVKNFVHVARLRSMRIVFASCCAFCIAGSGGLTTTRAQQSESQASPPGAATTQPAALAVSDRSDHYRIGANDVLDIRIFNRPELSREAVRVDERGMIAMPLVDADIPAACRTERELARDLAARYRRYLRNPYIDVFVKEYQSQPVAVLGAVRNPGRFQLQRRVRLLDVLALAGPTERAGGTIKVVRGASAGCADPPAAPVASDAAFATSSTAPNELAERQAIPIESLSSYEMNATLRGDEAANPYLQAGDVVTIAEAEQAFVIGNVLRPTPVTLKQRVTLTEALAMAGGTLPDTKKEKIRITRRSPDGTNKTELFYDLNAINKRQAEDIALQPNDIVEVDTASGKRFFRTLLGAVAPAAAQLPVNVVR